jgi:hypothetical protein
VAVAVVVVSDIFAVVIVVVVVVVVVVVAVVVTGSIAVVIFVVVVVVAHFESSRYISTGSRPLALNSSNLTSSVGTGTSIDNRSVTGRPVALGVPKMVRDWSDEMMALTLCC